MPAASSFPAGERPSWSAADHRLSHSAGLYPPSDPAPCSGPTVALSWPSISRRT